MLMKLEQPIRIPIRITQKFGANPSTYKKFGLAIFSVWRHKANNIVDNILEHSVAYRFLNNCDKRNIFQTKWKLFDVTQYGRFGKGFEDYLCRCWDVVISVPCRLYDALITPQLLHILHTYNFLSQELYNSFHRTLSDFFSFYRKASFLECGLNTIGVFWQRLFDSVHKLCRGFSFATLSL